MTGHDIVKSVADAVLEKFSAGLELDPDTEHYLLSCEGLSSVDEITGYLLDSGNYTSPVFQLLIYPDTEMRLAIERIIPPEGCSRRSIDDIIRMVKIPERVINIAAYGRKIPFRLETFSDHAEEYVIRLNLDINTALHPEGVNAFIHERMLLRRRRFIHSADSAEFFRNLAGKAAEGHAGPGIFPFALELIDAPGERIIDQLERKKYFYESAMKDAWEFSRLNSRYSMEFLMSKKVAPPLVGFDEAAEGIKKIDLITSLVYGFIIPSMDQGTEMFI